MLQNQHVHFQKLINFHGKFENNGNNINSVEEYVFSKKWQETSELSCHLWMWDPASNSCGFV